MSDLDKVGWMGQIAGGGWMGLQRYLRYERYGGVLGTRVDSPAQRSPPPGFCRYGPLQRLRPWRGAFKYKEALLTRAGGRSFVY